MARAEGYLVMDGDKDGDYQMYFKFSDDTVPPQRIRETGYYLGRRTVEGMRAFLADAVARASKSISMQFEDERPSSSVENFASTSVAPLPTVESQSSTESLREARQSQVTASSSLQATIESPVEEPERPQSVGGFLTLKKTHKQKPVRSVGRMPLPSAIDQFSDDENELQVSEIADYSVLDEDLNPVSLSKLPLFNPSLQNLVVSDGNHQFSVKGKSRGENIMRPINAWQLEFPENRPPHFLVRIAHKGDNDWVKLEKPQSGYKKIADELFFVAKFLAFVKKEPDASEEAVWGHLIERDVTEATICEYLTNQYILLSQYITLDPELSKTTAMETLMKVAYREKRPEKRKLLDEDGIAEDDTPLAKKRRKVPRRTGGDAQNNEKVVSADTTSISMADDTSMREDNEEEEEDQDDNAAAEEEGDEVDEADEELGDTLCIICDDGGDLLCCDGPCMRSFHAYKEAVKESNCKSLGFDKAALENMERWLCKNCKYKSHQCFICGGLGTSDEELRERREVFVCDVALCGKFYHPHCVVKEIAPISEQISLARSIQEGKDSFTCPVHRCKACGKGEDKKVEDLKIARCRRCPAAWHKGCLPSSIRFDDSNGDQRAWEVGQEQKRYIIYCTKHVIIKELGTPLRNHLKYPEPSRKNLGRSTPTVQDEPPGFEARVPSATVRRGTSEKSKQQRRDHHAPLFPNRRSESSYRASSLVSPRHTERNQSEDAARRAILEIIAESEKMVTPKSVRDKLKLPRNYSEKFQNREFIHVGKMESILKAAGKAVLRLNKGTLEDAFMICSRNDIEKIDVEEECLRTFLAPTLHGNRYTPYGRHFTKVEKLREVVELLEYYILDGDTILDFSCGENTFSKLLRDRLLKDENKYCKFKNFDIFTPKEMFGFEQRDWFDVQTSEFPNGKELVIGLNPPFAGMDKFVSHALDFRPRLLVLIVPPLAKPLERRGYTCLLDDDNLMVGKSFYLPGSVHETSTDVLEQGNNIAPHIYIYCRNEFIRIYRETAEVARPNNTQRPSQSGMLPKPTAKSSHHSKQVESTANIFVPEQISSILDTRKRDKLVGAESSSGQDRSSQKKSYQINRNVVQAPQQKQPISTHDQNLGRVEHYPPRPNQASQQASVSRIPTPQFPHVPIQNLEVVTASGGMDSRVGSVVGNRGPPPSVTGPPWRLLPPLPRPPIIPSLTSSHPNSQPLHLSQLQRDQSPDYPPGMEPLRRRDEEIGGWLDC